MDPASIRRMCTPSAAPARSSSRCLCRNRCGFDCDCRLRTLRLGRLVPRLRRCWAWCRSRILYEQGYTYSHQRLFGQTARLHTRCRHPVSKDSTGRGTWCHSPSGRLSRWNSSRSGRYENGSGSHSSRGRCQPMKASMRSMAPIGLVWCHRPCQNESLRICSHSRRNAFGSVLRLSQGSSLPVTVTMRSIAPIGTVWCLQLDGTGCPNCPCLSCKFG